MHYVTFPFRSVTLLELPVWVVIAAAPHACSRYPWLKWKIRDCSQSKTLFRLRLDLPTSWAHSLSQARSASGRLFMFSAARRERELELPEPEMRSEGLWESLGIVNIRPACVREENLEARLRARYPASSSLRSCPLPGADWLLPLPIIPLYLSLFFPSPLSSQRKLLDLRLC